ncbi:MFS transporter [Aeromicrobium sp. Root472D3]|uniref:MFS transporter n=1 Tax=Aeromicrobium sp. Root472D3 TaxID=1736540 RepID=UPI0019100AAE|nr:MFS transporter [Aeromicrobium sp. Root472D3]
MTSTSAPSSADRRGRLGASLMFFTNGVLFSALLPRYPEIKAHFGLSDTQFGLTVVAFAAGAICAAAAAAPMIRRWGATRVTWVGSIVLATTMAVAGGSPSAWVFAAALFAAGLTDAIVDAAQNVAGIAVEKSYGRSIINSLHAVWSLGAATGGVIGAVSAALDVGIGVQMVVNGTVWSIAALVASRLVTSGAAAQPVVDAPAATAAAEAGSPRAWRLLAPLVLLAICGTLIEDIANNWSVLFMRDETTAPVAVAGLAVSVMIGAQFVGRLLGDRMTDRWGREGVARAGGVLIGLGMVVAATSPTAAVALVGFALAGFGSATLVPAAFAAADRVPGLSPGTGVAMLGWLMRLGFLVTSPCVGALSDATDLRVALAIPVGAGVVAAVIAHLASRRRHAARADVVPGDMLEP